jgi:DnaJ-class molecular chaperone
MSSRSRSLLAVLGVSALLALSGCDGDGDDGNGEPSGNECPPGGTTHTYQNFGQQFFQSYCTRCHSSTLSGPQRNGAPDGLNWDQLAVVRANAEEINEEAGVTDGNVNTSMPPSDPRPTEQERRQLAEWLSCGAP